MAKSFVLAALLALACGPLTLDDELEAAKAAWGVIEMCPAQAHEVDQLTLNEISGADEREQPQGCDGTCEVQGYADIPGCAVYVVMRLDWDRRARVLEHELGHIIKGKNGHLDCQDQPGDDRMCSDGGGPWVDAPTDRDRAFVRSR